MTSHNLAPLTSKKIKIEDSGKDTNFTESKALVIIDVQNEFISAMGNFPISDTCKPALLKNLKSLIPRFRKAGGFIIWVQAEYDDRVEEPPHMKVQQKGDGVVGNNEWLTSATHVYHIPCCKPRTWGAEIYPEIFALADSGDAVAIKRGYSAFNGTTALLEVLREKNVKHAYFCGVASGTCVLATILDAVKLEDMQFYAVPDCMGYRRYNTHVEALQRMKALNVPLLESGQL